MELLTRVEDELKRRRALLLKQEWCGCIVALVGMIGLFVFPSIANSLPYWVGVFLFFLSIFMLIGGLIYAGKKNVKGKELERTLFEAEYRDCPHCGGSGYIKR